MRASRTHDLLCYLPMKQKRSRKQIAGKRYWIRKSLAERSSWQMTLNLKELIDMVVVWRPCILSHLPKLRSQRWIQNKEETDVQRLNTSWDLNSNSIHALLGWPVDCHMQQKRQVLGCFGGQSSCHRLKMVNAQSDWGLALLPGPLLWIAIVSPCFQRSGKNQNKLWRKTPWKTQLQ